MLYVTFGNGLDCCDLVFVFSVKQEVANIFCKQPDSACFSFVGHMASIAATQCCCSTSKATTDHRQTNGCGCAPVKPIYSHRWRIGFVLCLVICQPLVLDVQVRAAILDLEVKVIDEGGEASQKETESPVTTELCCQLPGFHLHQGGKLLFLFMLLSVANGPTAE